jgi:EmrB/QacA subfamily drug resistance transporter
MLVDPQSLCVNNDLSPARRRAVLATCCLSLFLVTMDVTIVNVALPAIRRDLHASVGGLQWSIDGYTVVVASFLTLAGSTADRVGRKRTFQAGLTLFGLGSLLSSLAPTTAALVGFRALQALGGAMMNPVAMSIIVNTFTDTRERARAIGIWGGVFGVSMAIGPLMGGILTEHLGWRAIFWVNVPIAAAAVFLTAKFVPESRAPRPRRIDPVGQALVVVALASLVSTVIDGRRLGWSSPLIVVGLVVAALSIAFFVVYERRREEPLVDLRFFKSIPFSSATILAILSFGAFAGFLFLNSLYLQDARGLGPEAAGLATLPIALALMICSPLSGRLVGAGHARLAIVVAGVAIATGGALLVRLEVTTPLGWLIVAYAVFGIGLGMINAPITNTAVSGMPRAQAGVAASVASTSRQIGSSLGVAVAGTVAAGGIHAAHAPNFASATHPVFWLVAVEGVVIALLGLYSTGRRAEESVRRLGPLLREPGAQEDGPKGSAPVAVGAS